MMKLDLPIGLRFFGNAPDKIPSIMMKYKILYITYHSQIGGGETILLSLLENLNRKLYEPIACVNDKGQLSAQLDRLKIKSYYLSLTGYLWPTFFIPGISLAGIYRLLKLVGKIKPDLIHLNHLNLAIYAGIAARYYHIPLIATAHGPWESVYFFQDLINNLFCNIILANTQDLSLLMLKRKIIKPDKITVLPFGVDTNIFKPGNPVLAKKLLNLPERNLVITMVGRIDPVKDHLTFLKAANVIRKRISRQLTFLIVGSSLGNFSHKRGYVEQIQDFLMINKDLAQQVVFKDYTDNIALVYQASDILVSSSRSESFGLSLAEGASSGLPIVTTDNGGQSLIVKNNISGFLVKPDNPDQLAQKIIILAQSKKLKKDFGQQARLHIIKNYPLNRYVKKVEEVYQQLLNKELRTKNNELNQKLN